MEPKKSRGRPRGRSPTINVVLPAELIFAIDAYAERETITRSEALRRIVEAWAAPSQK